MITEVIKYSGVFILLMLVQVIILNNIQFSGFINPYSYIMFLMILPVRIPKLALLFLAFFTGIVADMFTNSLGIHASACLVLAFIRPSLLHFLAPRDGYESDAVPSVKGMGFKWYLIFASILTLTHHLTLFYIEVFRFTEFFSTLYRVFASSSATLLVIILMQYLFVNYSDSAK